MAKNLSGLDVRGRKQQPQLAPCGDVPGAFPFPSFDRTLNGLKHWTESEPQDFQLTTTTTGLNTLRQSCLHPAGGAVFLPLYELLAT